MDKEQKIKHWLNMSNYDITSAYYMLSAGRYTYVVFTCQQAIEKSMKALYLKIFDEESLRTHNINFLFYKSMKNILLIVKSWQNIIRNGKNFLLKYYHFTLRSGM